MDNEYGDHHVLLAGVVGSVAYGLDGPDSDVDRLGVYAAPTSAFYGLHLPVDKAATVVRHDPDVTLHEARKFATLALSCNPTITELMWLTDHEVVTEWGAQLVAVRRSFLSAKRVRDAYLGYATSQLGRLTSTGRFQSKMRSRVEKHARHLLRLLDQGAALYSTGILPIRVLDRERYFGFGRQVAAEAAAGDYAAVRSALAAVEWAFDAYRSPLPDRPDEDAVELWLHGVRRAFL